MKDLKAGDWVTIFEDPITEQHPEGTAQLVEHILDVHGDAQAWKVRFEGDPDDELYSRTIKV